MPFPAYVTELGLLEEAECDALREWAIARAETFAASAVKDHEVKANFRNSRTIKKIGDPWRPVLEAAIAKRLPDLFTALGTPPFEPARIELQLTAHNDGEYFKRHIDTQTGDSKETTVRLISFVYYFSASPARFSGGALRLYGFGEDTGQVDIEPVRNSLAVFPSWAPHEVLPVACTSGRFEDSRFAINGWLRRAKVPASKASR